MGFKKGNNEIVLWWLFLNWCWYGVDVVLVWKWYVALMLRWCGHSVSGSGPEPCQVSTLLLGDTGPPFQLIGRLLLSPHPKKQCEKWTISLQSVLNNWDRLASGGKSFHGVWICGQKWWQIIPALICLHLLTFLCVKKHAGALLTI